MALPTPVPSFVLRSAVARLYRRLAFAAPSAIDPGVISAFTYHHRRRARVAHYLDTAHRLLPELADPFQLERISSRVLLIWGDRDRMVYARGAAKLLEAVPGSRLELLAGSATALRSRPPIGSSSCCSASRARPSWRRCRALETRRMADAERLQVRLVGRPV